MSLKQNNNNRTKIKNRYGIVPIPIYVQNYRCKVSCIYCPKVPKISRSYLLNEDTKRAIQANYEPKKQLDYWIAEIDNKLGNNHPVKIEIIILGGTFGDLSNEYRIDFFKRLYDGLNGCDSINLEEAKLNNKKSHYRACVVTIETRPDTIDLSECIFLRRLGVTKIELGIQSIYDNILDFARRPYNKQDIINATKLIKEEGFKLGYHVMLNLPLSSIDLDSNMLHKIIEEKSFQPDFIKIYPLTLINNHKYQTEMWELFKNGIWKPYKKESLLTLISKFETIVPEYIRIQRIQRQFDNNDYLYKNSKIQNEVEYLLNNEGKECKCIRCQEIKTYKSGIKQIDKTTLKIIVIKINNIGSYFFSLNIDCHNESYLIGYLRLQISDKAMIREIKILGIASIVGKRGQFQGFGFGKIIMKEVECFVKKLGFSFIYVNASPGVRVFFENLEYYEYENMMKKHL